MGRTVKDSKLDSRAARLRLAHRVNPYWTRIGDGESLGYYRPEGKGPGTWSARHIHPETRGQLRHKLGTADDYSDADGRTVLSFTQAQEKARKWFAQARANAAGERLHTGPFTVEHAMEAYVERLERTGQATAKDAPQRIRLHILPDLGKAEVAKLTRPRLEKWRDGLASHPGKTRGRKGEAPKDRPEFADEDARRARKATVNRTLAILKAALTYAKDQGLVNCPDDPWRYTKPFRGVTESRKTYLTPEEQVRLLNSIADADFKRLVSGALLTGARYGELARMQVRDFDASGTGSVLITKGKNGRPRRVILTAEGRAFFESITAGRPAGEFMFLKDADPRLKAVKNGELTTEPWGRSEQAYRMTASCKAAALPRMGFHQLRHSYASALVSAGMPLAMVAKLTGHSDTRMLEQHYAHLAQSDLSRALEALAPKLAEGLEKPRVATLKLNRG